HRSRPARASGRVMAWMGNGSVMPWADSHRTMGAGTPRSAKERDTEGLLVRRDADRPAGRRGQRKRRAAGQVADRAPAPAARDEGPRMPLRAGDDQSNRDTLAADPSPSGYGAQ